MANPFKELTITNIKQETPSAKIFYFDTDIAKQIHYKSGQYLTLVLPHSHPEIRRSYSIISSPQLNETLAVGVKRIENGAFSRWLIDKAKTGDKILTSGIGGFFTLPADIENYSQIFFLAAGSGITPIFSLLKTVLYKYPNISVVLICSNHVPHEAMFHADLVKLSDEFAGRFLVEFMFSNAMELSKARLYRDLLITLLKKYSDSPKEKTLAYTCGPINYMRMCIYAFRLCQIPFDNIKKENFNIQKPALLPLPPDQDAHLVNVGINQKQYKFFVKYPDTILSAAKKNNILLPYSCEAGKCGNCAARILSGKVWMSYNEVLTDKDIANGLTLTCVGFPIGGDAAIAIE